MTTLTIPAVSRQHVIIPVTGPDNATDEPVWIAFTDDDAAFDPTESDWHTAEWSDGMAARIMIGPDAIALEPGLYAVWLRVGDETPFTDERPVLRAGLLQTI